jgi:hypothetical protein
MGRKNSGGFSYNWWTADAKKRAKKKNPKRANELFY